jgi:protein ImuB
MSHPTHGSVPGRMYGILFVPRFRLQAVLTQDNHAGLGLEDAIGLLDGSSARGLLLEITRTAAASGVEPGMNASQALARCPALQLVAASEVCEQAAAKRLLQFVETLSPRVEKQAPDRWLLDLGGIQAPNWHIWADTALDRLLGGPGLEGCLGIAPKPGLAWCAARRAARVRVVEETESFLEELTFGELEVSQALQQQLTDWGIHTLGQLLELPKQATLERLGPEAVGLWEIARDSRESVLRLETFPEPLQLAMEYEHPVETVEPVLFTLNRMLEQLASRMRLLHRVASGMILRLALENGPPHERAFTIPAPTRQEAVLLRILQTHLESLQLEAALTAVFLQIHETLPYSQQLALFENPLRDPNRFGETLARLHALTGENRIGVPCPADTHRPGAFTLEDPVKAFASPPGTVVAFPGHDTFPPAAMLGLPLRRFRPAQPAIVVLERHRPAHLVSENIHGTIVDCRGPYRLSGTWWEASWRLEQWDVLLAGKHQGLYQLAHSLTPPESWVLEGCYDAAAWPLPPIPKPSPACT